MTNELSPKKLSYLAGLLYLTVAIFGGLAHLFVRAKVYVPGNATETAQNIGENVELVRFGVAADLIQATAFILLALTIHALFNKVNRNVATTLVTLVAISVSIICLNIAFQYATTLVVGDATYVQSFGADGRDSLVQLLMDLQFYGYLFAQIFYSSWLIPLGYLAYKGGLIPKWLSWLLVAGCIGYLTETFTYIISPDFAKGIAELVVLPASLAEFSMIVFLFLRASKLPTNER